MAWYAPAPCLHRGVELEATQVKAVGSHPRRIRRRWSHEVLLRVGISEPEEAGPSHPAEVRAQTWRKPELFGDGLGVGLAHDGVLGELPEPSCDGSWQRTWWAPLWPGASARMRLKSWHGGAMATISYTGLQIHFRGDLPNWPSSHRPKVYRILYIHPAVALHSSLEGMSMDLSADSIQ